MLLCLRGSGRKHNPPTKILAQGKHMTKLLGSSHKIDLSNNQECNREEKFLTTVMYLSPATESGYNMCPFKTDGCEAMCLGHSSGMMIFPANKQARINRTMLLMTNRDAFNKQITKEIEAHIRKADKLGATPAIRLNGDSDLRWESMKFDGQTLIEKYPNVVWYDYTKWPINLRPEVDNYHLTFSRSEKTTLDEIQTNLDAGRNVAVVFDVVPTEWNGWTVINGDESDERFLDVKGVIVGLKAKGAAKKDTSGFVVRLAN